MGNKSSLSKASLQSDQQEQVNYQIPIREKQIGNRKSSPQFQQGQGQQYVNDGNTLFQQLNMTDLIELKDDSPIPEKKISNKQEQSYDIVKNLDLAIRCRFNQIKQLNEAQQIPIMVQVHTKDEEVNDEQLQLEQAKKELLIDNFAERSIGVDLICVIDHSGSMGDFNKMQLANQTLEYIAEQLTPIDRLSIVKFDSSAHRICGLTTVTKENRGKIKEIVETIKSQGGTNIQQGMEYAFQVLKNRRYVNDVTSIFLLSDGLDGQAEIKVRQSLLQSGISEECFTIHTFGFGKDHDPKLMAAISDLKDGSFYYIADLAQLAECFVDALGGLFSVVAENIKISIKVNPEKYGTEKSPNINFKVSKVFGNMFKKIEDNHYQILMPQLTSGTNKDFIFEVEFPAQVEQVNDFNRNINLVDLEFECVDMDKKSHKFTKSLQLSFLNKEDEANLDEDGEVIEHYYRVQAAEAIQLAMNNAEKGQFQEGNKILESQIQKIANLPVKSKKLESVQQDLIQNQKACSNREKYEQGGRNEMQFVTKCHMEQKSKPMTFNKVSLQSDMERIECNAYANRTQKRMAKNLY